MRSLRLVLPGAVLPDPVLPTFADLRRELEVREPFPPDVLAEAAAAAAAPDLPSDDLTGLPFLTIDPESSRDLDQAVHLARDGGGYRVSYAIADVAAFVRPGGALDAETLLRGETLYAPDVGVPLHPPVLGEGAASLLPELVRPAVVWDLRLGADGEPTVVDVRRALVRSRRRLSYDSAQADLDAGRADEQLLLLREVGLLRQERARDRGAVDLPALKQQVDVGPDGAPVLSLRHRCRWRAGTRRSRCSPGWPRPG